MRWPVQIKFHEDWLNTSRVYRGNSYRRRLRRRWDNNIKKHLEESPRNLEGMELDETHQFLFCAHANLLVVNINTIKKNT
jgi:hypothetical protein